MTWSKLLISNELTMDGLFHPPFQIHYFIVRQRTSQKNRAFPEEVNLTLFAKENILHSACSRSPRRDPAVRLTTA